MSNRSRDRAFPSFTLPQSMERSLGFFTKAFLVFSIVLNIYLLFSPLRLYVYVDSSNAHHADVTLNARSSLNQKLSLNNNNNNNNNLILQQSANLLQDNNNNNNNNNHFPYPHANHPNIVNNELIQSIIQNNNQNNNYSFNHGYNFVNPGPGEAYPFPYHRFHLAERFLAISPYGGFNNQLDHLYFQIGWARTLGLTLVLPKFSSSHHTRDRGFFSIETYLDVYEISKMVKVISWEDFVVLCNRHVDVVVAVEKIRQKPDNYRTFEIMEAYNMTHGRLVAFNSVGEALTATRLRNFFLQHDMDKDRCIMANGMPRFDDFDKKDFSEVAPFFQVRNSVRMATYIHYLAEHWIKANIGANKPFLAVHFRRGDFEPYCKLDNLAVYPYVHQANLLTTKSFPRSLEANNFRPGCYPALDDAIRNITFVANQCKVENIFLSTNADSKELEELSTALVSSEFKVFRFARLGEQFVPNVETTIDISINSLADCFLGNKYSSLTFTILTKRRQLEVKKSWDSAYLF